MEKSGGMDPIQDTLKQLSRLAGGGQPNQTNILQSADSNQPIVHQDRESNQQMGNRDTQSADGRKSEDSNTKSNESKEAEALSESSQEDGGHIASVKNEIPDEFSMSDS